MKYVLYAGSQNLVNILREIQSQGCGGVIGREWLVMGDTPGFWLKSDEDRSWQDMFPETEPDVYPVIEGMRLLERSALISYFDQTQFARFIQGNPDEFDLVITTDEGAPLVIETDDEDVSSCLEKYFASV